MYLGIILTEQVEDLYNKNFEIFKKNVKMSEDGKLSHAPGSEGLIQ